MPRPEDIAIERLYVSGDKQAAQRLARELEYASWPMTLPVYAQNAWIFVRELKVSGQPQGLRQQTALQLQSALAQAIDGRSAHANANVVRFASLPELLAFLLRDLSLGQAAGKWYWQRWQYLFRQSRDQAIAELMCENIAELAAVVEQLAATRSLSLVWQTLSSSTAQAIVAQLVRHYSIPLEPDHSSTDTLINLAIQQAAVRQFQQQAVWLGWWKPLLAQLSVSDSRWQLAALITAISQCPLLVMREPRVVIAAFVEQFVSVPLADTAPESVISASVSADVEQTQEGAGKNPDVSLQHFPVPDRSGLDSDSINTAPAQNAFSGVSKQTSHGDLSSGAQTSLTPSNHPLGDYLAEMDRIAESQVNTPISAQLRQPMGSTEEPLPSSIYPIHSQFITRFGGFFYLINALHNELTPEFLVEHRLASGWLWLFDCGRLLAERAGVELDQPLLRFIALTLGYEEPAALVSLPPSPKAEMLLAQMDRRFNTQAFWPDFLSNRAHIIANASHIDVYFALASVRLDIRLAGLDVNPGWVPWLGRVVAFHYVESLGGEQHAH